MKYYSIAAAAAFVLTIAGAPAFAQMSPSGMGGGMGGGTPGAPGGAPKPLDRVPDIAPPALPGAGAVPLATGPVMAKPLTGDPTVALFGAVNSGDYNLAQDAISRGANLTAEDPLGETPLDLAVSLNRTPIVFLLLSARNEGDGGPAVPSGPAPRMTHHKTAPLHIVPVDSAPVHVKIPAVGNDPGTPNAAAGFLGFTTKN
jgi:hypothetical protein